MMEKIEKLIAIQQELNAPKDKENKFGGYKYRSCESILEAVKPLLKKAGLALVIHDEIIMLGTRFYVKAEAKLIDTKGELVAIASAYAREEEDKKGMDAAQLTGATSSYARKYALNGLFAIDDAKDADTNEYREQQMNAQKAEKKQQTQKQDPKPEQKQEPKPAAQQVQLTAEQDEAYRELCADLDAADNVPSVLATCLMAEGQPYELLIRKAAAKKGIALATSKAEVNDAYNLIKDREGWEEMKEYAVKVVKVKGLN